MSFNYCLVRWLKEDKLGVIVLSSVVTEEKEKVLIGNTYLCKYGANHYKAIVVFVGTNKQCKDKLNELSIKQAKPRSRSSSKSSTSQRESTQHCRFENMENVRPSTSKKTNHVRYGEYVGDLNGPSQRTQSKYAKFHASSLESDTFQSMFAKKKNALNRHSTANYEDDCPNGSFFKPSQISDDGESSNEGLDSDFEIIEEKKAVKTVRGQAKSKVNKEIQIYEKFSENERDAAKSLAKLNASSKTVFSKDEKEIQNYVLTEKLTEREREVREARIELDKLKKKNAELQEKSSSLANLIKPEEREKILQMSLSAIKQFGEPRHIVEITNYNKEMNLIESKVSLSNQEPSVLICPATKASLVQDIEAGLAMSKVFKDLMLSFYPNNIDWASRNADMFLNLCPNTINAAIHFLNENNPNSTAKFTRKNARKALREKCADTRKKIRAAGHTSPEFEFLFNNLEETDSDASDNEDEQPKATQVNKENTQPLDESFNSVFQLNCTMDEDIVNPKISSKHRLESDSSLCSIFSTKKSKF